MHPTRETLAHQRRLETLEPKAVRMARSNRFPFVVILPLAALGGFLGLLVGFHVTHQGHLPRDRAEFVTWLTTGR